MIAIIVVSILTLLPIFVGIAAKIIKNKLNKIDQTQLSFISNLKVYEGKLLICGYIDENLPAQEIFDTSQLDDKGLMAIIYVNQNIEPIIYENALVGYDEEGICSVIVL